MQKMFALRKPASILAGPLMILYTQSLVQLAFIILRALLNIIANECSRV